MAAWWHKGFGPVKFVLVLPSVEEHDLPCQTIEFNCPVKPRLYGTIGFNGLTGEIVFFDGRKDRDEFDWSMPFVPPGGHSYSDRIGRAAAEALYDPTFHVQCSECHDNKNAYVVDPHAQQARVGYLGGRDDPRAIAFSLGDYLPETPRVEGASFRVIGSGYTSTYRVELSRARTVRDPTGNCTTCHTLTTQITGQRFAADAVAQEPWISNPSWAQQLELVDEKMNYSQIAAHRTDWASGRARARFIPGWCRGTVTIWQHCRRNSAPQSGAS